MKAIHKLQEMDYQDKVKKYPAVPDYAIPKTKFSQKGTNSITKSILSFLQLHGHFCSRIQSQGQYNPTLQRWTKSTVRRGIGDITAIIHGRSVMVEVKAGKDKMSPWQLRTKQEVEKSGGLYYIARNFDDFVIWYQSNEHGNTNHDNIARNSIYVH